MTAEIKVNNTRLVLVRGDITHQKADAIVNAANSGLMGGGGVDGAIHRAGGPKILEECREIVSRIGRLPPGHAVITTGGNLPATYVIHTVGPVWRGGGHGEAKVLASCYTEALRIASEKNLSSIAFPAISTGVYGYPQEEAARISVAAVTGFITANPTSITTVFFVVYDLRAYELYSNEMVSSRGR
jgi:O-acetyl-ADP-ribose deacetylase (regulator of RNase III)